MMRSRFLYWSSFSKNCLETNKLFILGSDEILLSFNYFLYEICSLLNIIFKIIGKKRSHWEIAEFIRIVVGKSLEKSMPIIYSSLTIFCWSNFSTHLGWGTWHQIAFWSLLSLFTDFIKTLTSYMQRYEVKRLGKLKEQW